MACPSGSIRFFSALIEVCRMQMFDREAWACRVDEDSVVLALCWKKDVAVSSLCF